MGRPKKITAIAAGNTAPLVTSEVTIIDVSKATTPVVQSASEISFNTTKEALEGMVAAVKQIKITDVTSLAIANQKMSTVNNHLKEIEAKRVELKAPFLEKSNMIDATAKQLKTILEDGIKHLKGEVLAWNNKLEQERKEAEEAAKKVNEAQAEIENDKRIVDYIGTVKTWLENCFANCTVDSGMTILNEMGKLPSADKMGKYAPEYSSLVEMYIKLFNTKVNELKGVIAAGTTENHLKTLGSHLDTQLNNIHQEVSHKAEEVATAITKASTANYTDQMASNVRKSWTFELVDIEKVKPEWLQLNDSAVKEYLKENKDTLVEGTIINGVKFFQTSSVVTK